MATGGKRKEYENIKKRAARGEFTLVDPLDYLILERLPEEGTLFAGLYPLGETAQNLIRKFPKGPDGKTLPTTLISGRLTSLHAQGILIKHASVPGASSHVWQRTKRGTKAFKEWKEKQGGTSSAQ